jgi:threonyl-tRNA synthetase
MIIRVNKTQEDLPEESTLSDLAKKLHLTAPNQAVAATVNGKLKDFTTTLRDGDEVIFLSFDDPAGRDIFWHTSAHVLAQAVLRLWPEAIPTIGPAIENGFYYDFANLKISEEDFEKINKEVQNVISENFIPKREEFKNKEEALKAFEKNPYKKELIEGLSEGSISSYKQGEFFDLCLGPHLPSIGKIKAFAVLKTSGAYWRADQTREMLTRIYGISFPDKKLLKDYLLIQEEAKKRDHKMLGQQLDLFSLKEEAPGMPFIHPKGMIIWENLIQFERELHKENNYVEIKTPVLMSKELWLTSGHWLHYRQNMYTSEVEKHEYAIKPMNCPGCMLFYKSTVHSYRELPLRIAEVGLVHRHEASGALNGLFRVRSFHQDDAHIIMEPKDIESEIFNVIRLADQLYKTFGIESYRLELSTRPDKSKTIGSDAEWEMATNGLKGALDKWGMPYRINEGDGAFYGPKIDFHIQDALGRTWQCATIQLDFSLPEKFGLEYVASTGEYKRPVMIHRVLYGSMERFFGILIEHFAGKFPLWISPIGVRVVPVADRHNAYAEELRKTIMKTGVSCDVDESNESVGKKIRNAQLSKINYMLTVGDQEMGNKTVSLRTRDNVVHGEINFAEFLETIKKEKESRALQSPFVAK